MRVLNSAHEDSFQSRDIVLTVMPAAVVDGKGRSYPKTEDKALRLPEHPGKSTVPLENCCTN